MPMLHDTGEEYYQDKLSGETFDVGLYNDNTDALSDGDDLTAISTEPGDGNYQRQTGQAFSSSDASGDWRLSNDSTVQFDTTNTTGTVDSAFVVVNFAADEPDADGDGTATDHLLFTASLDGGSVDLSNVDTFDLNTVALDLT